MWCKTDGRQERRDAGKKGCRKRRDTGKEEFRARGIQEWMGSGLEGYRNGWIHERSRSRKGWIQDGG